MLLLKSLRGKNCISLGDKGIHLGEEVQTDDSPSAEESESVKKFSVPIDNPSSPLNYEKCGSILSSEDSAALALLIVEFITKEDSPNVEILRKSMYCQMERVEIRLKGLEMISELLRKNQLIASVKYALLNGWLGNCHKKEISLFKPTHCLDNVHLVTPYYKMQVTLAQAKVSSWVIDMLRQFVAYSDSNRNSSGFGEKVLLKDSLVGWTKRLPWTRFVLSLIAILTRKYKGNEISFIINSGVLSLLQTLLRQIFQKPILEQKKDNKSKEEFVIFEDTAEKSKAMASAISGPELASKLKIGMFIFLFFSFFNVSLFLLFLIFVFIRNTSY